jgi:C-terminal processing protease CtpA/Prc
MKTQATSLIVLLTLVSAVTAAPQPELFGIGAQLISGGGTSGPRIHEIVPNSPAANAKLSTGLIVSKVDGIPTAGKRLDEVINLIRGPARTTVRLELTDPTDGKTSQVALPREKLEYVKKIQ